MADVKLFLSCVSDEFGDYREALRRALDQPNVTVKIQEDFKPQGGDTLRMLQEYIEQCEAVVHFVGDMDGSAPKPRQRGRPVGAQARSGSAAREQGHGARRVRDAQLHAMGGVARDRPGQGPVYR